MNKDKFYNRQPKIIEEEQLRKYAVLVPIIKTTEGLYLLFEKRSHKLNAQPGEICFPGGKLEPNETLAECAIRETVEELMIDEQQIDLIGPGDIFVSPFNIIIYPFLGVLNDYQYTYSTEEVADVIKVPLEFFLNNKPTIFKSRVITNPHEDFPYEWIPNGKNYRWAKGNYDVLFYRYENTVIWGITARIIKSMISLIEEYDLL